MPFVNCEGELSNSTCNGNGGIPGEADLIFWATFEGTPGENDYTEESDYANPGSFLSTAELRDTVPLGNPTTSLYTSGGDRSRVKFDNIPAYDLNPNTNFELEFSFHGTNIDSSYYPIERDNLFFALHDRGLGDFMGIYVDQATLYPKFELANTLGNNFSFLGSTAIPNETDCQLKVTKQGDIFTIYFNGVEDGTITMSGVIFPRVPQIWIGVIDNIVEWGYRGYSANFRFTRYD